MKSGPPGWEPHKTTVRVDGWICDPKDEHRIPARVANLIAAAMPHPGDRHVVATIRMRVMARQLAHQRKKKVRIARLQRGTFCSA